MIKVKLSLVWLFLVMQHSKVITLCVYHRKRNHTINSVLLIVYITLFKNHSDWTELQNTG